MREAWHEIRLPTDHLSHTSAMGEGCAEATSTHCFQCPLEAHNAAQVHSCCYSSMQGLAGRTCNGMNQSPSRMRRAVSPASNVCHPLEVLLRVNIDERKVPAQNMLPLACWPPESVSPIYYMTPHPGTHRFAPNHCMLQPRMHAIDTSADRISAACSHE